ncbi:hypothetical protein DH2020_030146 [Rehmannia glutinosa]|uniref:Cupin type-1 domain-containing protein n=1 Tax=Rehmannia glutinosa TaxID=99300 RepID=A0ABR0VN83_REHGL
MATTIFDIYSKRSRHRFRLHHTPNFFGSINGSFFTYTGLRSTISNQSHKLSKSQKLPWQSFQPWDGQSISFAVLEFPPGGINPPHTHSTPLPNCSSSHLALLRSIYRHEKRAIHADSQDRDMFVFPKGLVHFQYNRNHQQRLRFQRSERRMPARFRSRRWFSHGIDDVILAKAFKTDVATVMKIKAGMTKP